MKFFSLLLLFVVLSVSVATLQAAETNFDPAIDDLPLMEGLKAVPDQDTLFTTPLSGRIAESVAKGSVSAEDVYRFYKASLPHLGWQRINDHNYRRSGERLHIDARADGSLTTVRFSIKPDR